MKADKQKQSNREGVEVAAKLRTRLLFLDFDGVLHPTVADPDFPHFCWLPILAAQVLPHPSVVIVVHSTWRYDHTNHELSVLLGALAPHFAGSAPRGPRAEVIGLVLQANKDRVLDHIVLDDDIKAFEGSSLNVLRTDPQKGLSSVVTQAALNKWLGGPEAERASTRPDMHSSNHLNK